MSRPAPGSSASSTPRPRRCCAAATATPPAANCTGRPAGWSRSPGICAYDSDAHGLAQRYFHQALRLAKASGDRGLGAYVIALLVNQSLFMREYRQAVAFAEAALRAAGPHITPALAADLYAMQAKAYAQLGDGSSALSCIRRAEAAAERIRRGHEPDETGYVQPGLVNVQVAEALLSLGDLAAAAGARGGRRRHPRARPRPGAPAGHAQPDRAAPGRGGPGGGDRRRRWRSRPGEWSRSGCGTGCGRCANIWLTSGAPATDEAAELIDGALRVPL